MSNGDVFEEYVKRFAATQGKDPEEVKNYQIVKEYKEWIDKECTKYYDYTGKEGILEKV